jgi:hypothetical protein
MIESFDKSHPNVLIEASFTGDRIAVKFNNDPLLIYDFNPDWTIAG